MPGCGGRMGKIAKLGLKGKLFFVSLIPIIGILVFLSFAMNGFTMLGNQLDQSYQIYAPKMLSLGELLAC